MDTGCSGVGRSLMIGNEHYETARVAGVTLTPPDSDEVTSWVLKIFDGDPSDTDTRRLLQLEGLVDRPMNAEECLDDNEETLRLFVSGWVRDSAPLVGFKRSWTRNAD